MASRTDAPSPTQADDQEVDLGTDLIARINTLLQNGADVPMSSLIAIAYRQLHKIAHLHRLGQYVSPTLSTTALVHETYLKLQQTPTAAIRDANHFFSLAARAMRFVITDHARMKLTSKHGGDVTIEALRDDPNLGNDFREAEQMLELNDALERLEGVFPRLAQVVSLRFYVGLGTAEIATLLDIDERTVQRDWQKARGWMLGELAGLTDLAILDPSSPA